MRPEEEYKKKVMWVKSPLDFYCKSGLIKLNGIDTEVLVGRNEDGWEHVSVRMRTKRLPRWDEMCQIKDLFWDEEEEVVQIHPKQSEYVNIAEALHLWRPVDGDWSKLGRR